ncbi:MAG: hypothetical protein KAH18_12165 [Psychromonas sp.]|nr:hypothetical protein [Psychromonas sp.]
MITTAIFNCQRNPNESTSTYNILPDIIEAHDQSVNNFSSNTYLYPMEKYFGKGDMVTLVTQVRAQHHQINTQLSCNPSKMPSALNAGQTDELNPFVIEISENELNRTSTQGSLVRFILKEMFRQLLFTRSHMYATDKNSYSMLIIECTFFAHAQPKLAIKDTHCGLCFVEYFKSVSDFDI